MGQGTHGTPPAGVNFNGCARTFRTRCAHQKNKRTPVTIAQRLDRNQWRAIAQFDVVGDDPDQVDN